MRRKEVQHQNKRSLDEKKGSVALRSWKKGSFGEKKISPEISEKLDDTSLKKSGGD